MIININKKRQNSGYLSLCYHYIRPEKKLDYFPKILGNRIAEFQNHIRMLKQYYQIIALDDAYRFSYSDFTFKNEEYGMLITFDDGLSDHYLAANILAEYGIKGTFFISTCILMERLPANPTIVHYCIATYGIDGFLIAYREALEEYKLNVNEYDVKFHKGKDDPWKTISNIKSNIKYRLKYYESRNVLLHVYKNLFLKDYPDAMEIMHLTLEQIHGILNMGHYIGVHSHSHISVAAADLTEEDFRKEMIEPIRYLEKTFHVPIIAFSYPFGDKKDCLDAKVLINRTKEYQLAFTVEKIVNTKDTSPFELGRYMPSSKDNDMRLKEILEAIINEKENMI